MNEKKDWGSQLRKIPDWTKGAIGLIVTLAGFIIAFRNDRYLYSVILGFSILIGLLYALSYIAFARSPSPFGGRGALKFERYRRLALAGIVVLIILTFVILNSRVGRTYLAFAFGSTPAAGFGRVLALDSDIYVSQIIKDPESGFPKNTKLAVWLSANGNYYVDSIRVKSNCSPFMSATSSGALPADANYVYSYTACSEKTYALNPALYLDSADQREVYFTLELVPEGIFGGGAGYAYATIYYHTPDGRKGSLILEESPANLVLLSQFLTINVLSDRFLMSPSGIQRGFEEGMEKLENVVEYKPLDISEIYSITDQSESIMISSYLNSPSLPAPPKIDLGTRTRINDLIIEQGKVSEILSGLSTGNPFYFDLCAGLANRECKQALLNTPFPPEYLWEKAWALTIMHLIRPDTELADFALANITPLLSAKTHSEINALPSWEHYSNTQDRLIFALTFHPVGPWFDVLVKIVEVTPSYMSGGEACKALKLLQNRMDEKQLEVVKAICDQ